MTSSNTPLLEFSNVQERAQLWDQNQESEGEELETEEEETVVKKQKKLKKKKARNGIQVVQGYVYLKLVGFQGQQRLSASQLVSHIPLKTLRKAGAKVLRELGFKRKRQKKRKPTSHNATCPTTKENETRPTGSQI